MAKYPDWIIKDYRNYRILYEVWIPELRDKILTYSYTRSYYSLTAAKLACQANGYVIM